jgi:hypothetical protein
MHQTDYSQTTPHDRALVFFAQILHIPSHRPTEKQARKKKFQGFYPRIDAQNLRVAKAQHHYTKQTPYDARPTEIKKWLVAEFDGF